MRLSDANLWMERHPWSAAAIMMAVVLGALVVSVLVRLPGLVVGVTAGAANIILAFARMADTPNPNSPPRPMSKGNR